MKHLIPLTIMALLLAGCGGELSLTESPRDKIEYNRTVAPATMETAESPLAKPVEKLSPPKPPIPAPTISIHEAASKGDIEIVRHHLAVQPEGHVNAKTGTGWTPLHLLCNSQGHASASQHSPAY